MDIHKLDEEIERDSELRQRRIWKVKHKIILKGESSDDGQGDELVRFQLEGRRGTHRSMRGKHGLLFNIQKQEKMKERE